MLDDAIIVFLQCHMLSGLAVMKCGESHCWVHGVVYYREQFHQITVALPYNKSFLYLRFHKGKAVP